jgi:predicted MPP superfamily phosphohydrolase
MSKRKVILKKFIWIFGFVAIMIVIFYGRWIEPFQLEINHLHVNSLKLNELLSGRTAVHISDLHSAGSDNQSKKIVEIVNELKPDFVFLTGDYVQWSGNYEPALDFLAKLDAPIGVWAVMGDYDYSNDRKSCLFCHEVGTGLPTQRHRVRFLRNSSEHLPIGGETLQIVGIDRYAASRKVDGGGDWPKLTMERASIVLSHDPMVFDDIAEEQSTLILSGDTHGGQVPLPLWVWSLLGYEKNAKYNRGFFHKGSNQMYVNKGVGTSHLPFRLMRRPEIAVLHF